jgi:hypothetical protein
MIWSQWMDSDGNYALFPGYDLPDWARTQDPHHVWMTRFDARSWYDLMRQYHDWMDWEPYRPMKYADDWYEPDKFFE